MLGVKTGGKGIRCPSQGSSPTAAVLDPLLEAAAQAPSITLPLGLCWEQTQFPRLPRQELCYLSCRHPVVTLPAIPQRRFLPPPPSLLPRGYATRSKDRMK